MAFQAEYIDIRIRKAEMPTATDLAAIGRYASMRYAHTFYRLVMRFKPGSNITSKKFKQLFDEEMKVTTLNDTYYRYVRAATKAGFITTKHSGVATGGKIIVIKSCLWRDIYPSKTTKPTT